MSISTAGSLFLSTAVDTCVKSDFFGYAGTVLKKNALIPCMVALGSFVVIIGIAAVDTDVMRVACCKTGGFYDLILINVTG